jgi:hypothetical protein
MRIPTVIGTIDRRILINYQAEKDCVERLLPEPFRPKLVNGKAIVGICLIRLKYIRPKGIQLKFGLSSENGAHRIAVEWTEHGEIKEGVYVPRRDTSSRLNSLSGGRIFPGVHHLANFSVKEGNGKYAIDFTSDDATYLSISAHETKEWSKTSVFHNIECASDFFKNGSVGYSPARSHETFDGLELKTNNWEVSPLAVTHVRSSFFEDEQNFPTGSVIFDNALLMKNIDHEWNNKRQLHSQSNVIECC